VIADESMTRLEPGMVGEICIRGPNVMRGYYKQPAETVAAVVDGWLRTGDLGTIDEEGYYYVVDRKKDVIIRGGQNIYPVDIEEVLYRCLPSPRLRSWPNPTPISENDPSPSCRSGRANASIRRR